MKFFETIEVLDAELDKTIVERATHLSIPIAEMKKVKKVKKTCRLYRVLKGRTCFHFSRCLLPLGQTLRHALAKMLIWFQVSKSLTALRGRLKCCRSGSCIYDLSLLLPRKYCLCLRQCQREAPIKWSKLAIINKTGKNGRKR